MSDDQKPKQLGPGISLEFAELRGHPLAQFVMPAGFDPKTRWDGLSLAIGTFGFVQDHLAVTRDPGFLALDDAEQARVLAMLDSMDRARQQKLVQERLLEGLEAVSVSIANVGWMAGQITFDVLMPVVSESINLQFEVGPSGVSETEGKK